MDPIYLIKNSQKKTKYKYVVTEQEAKNYIQEKAETVRNSLSANSLKKVYITSDTDHDIKVLVQKVGNMWNGFLEEYVTFSYFPVDHILTEADEEKSDSEEDDDEVFVVDKNY